MQINLNVLPFPEIVETQWLALESYRTGTALNEFQIKDRFDWGV
jgi:hypothetical protein